MGAEIRVEIPEGLKSGDVLLSQEVASGLRSSAFLVEGTAKQLAPVSTGNLRRSIASQVAPLAGKPVAIVSPQAHYAPYVEYGTRPHAPPFAPIERWAVRHGAKPWAIWQTIKKRGTRKHPYLHPALERNRSRVVQRLHDAIDKALRRMGQ